MRSNRNIMTLKNLNDFVLLNAARLTSDSRYRKTVLLYHYYVSAMRWTCLYLKMIIAPFTHSLPNSVGIDMCVPLVEPDSAGWFTRVRIWQSDYIYLSAWMSIIITDACICIVFKSLLNLYCIRVAPFTNSLANSVCTGCLQMHLL